MTKPKQHATLTTPSKEKKLMPRKGIKTALKDNTKNALSAGAQAAQRKLATAAVKSMIAAAKGSAGDSWPLAFDTPIGRLALELGAPFILSTVCDAFAGENPVIAGLSKALAPARDAAVAELVEKGSDFIIPLLEDFAATGGMLMAGQGPSKALKAGKSKLDSIILENAPQTEKVD